jgi:hypothetical protein
MYTDAMGARPSFTFTGPNGPDVRRRPQKYQETWRVVSGVRTSRLLGNKELLSWHWFKQILFRIPLITNNLCRWN